MSNPDPMATLTLMKDTINAANDLSNKIADLQANGLDTSEIKNELNMLRLYLGLIKVDFQRNYSGEKES